MYFSQGKYKEKFGKIVSCAKYKDLVDEALWLYDKYCTEDLKGLKYSDYVIYYKTGSRIEYESEYFKHRAALNASAVLSLLYGGDYIQKLEDVIWAICDEYSWAFPAHVPIENGCDFAFIDLFAAETGFALSEIFYMLGDKLSFLVKERIKLEVERRIIRSFLERKYHWETIKNNWASVCAGSVGCAFILLFPHLFPEAKQRISDAMSYFLKGYGDDGACPEGYSYWVYGFGYFVYYAHLLREFSEGKEDYFKHEKVKRIASFRQKSFIQGNVVASFSDSRMTSSFIAGLEHFLRNEYPDSIDMPNPKYRSDYRKGTGENGFRYAHFIRTFLWFDKKLQYHNQKEGWYYLPDAQWYISKKQRYSFAGKAGDNGEPHNHNDVGSFIIAAGNKQCLCDLGMGEYNKDYFSAKTRYGIITNSSLGHSVPIICGQAQTEGKNFKGRVISADEKRFKVDIKQAYAVDELKEAVRQFEFNENEIRLTDSFVISSDDVLITERFVSVQKPRIEENKVIVGDLSLTCGSHSCLPYISEMEYKLHNAKEGKVYFIDFLFSCQQTTSSVFTFNFIDYK